MYTLTLFFRAFGPTETVARLPSILASIAIIHEIARDVYGRRTAALAALLLAVSPSDIQFAPTAFSDPTMVAQG